MNALESSVNKQNLLYRKSGRALILKIPTPMLLTQKGIVPQSSTVDFAGIVNGGRFIAFDAKECSLPTNFPLKNIHQHQQEYLKTVRNLGGYAFYFIHMKAIHKDKYYVVTPDIIDNCTRKSIPIKDLKDEWLTSIDYLETVCHLVS